MHKDALSQEERAARRKESDARYYMKNKVRLLARNNAHRLANKEADKNRKAAYYQRTKIKSAAFQKAWKKSNPEKVKASASRYRAKHAEAIKAKRDAKPEDSKRWNTDYYRKNKSKSNDQARKYAKDHPEKVKQYRKKCIQAKPEVYRALKLRYIASLKTSIENAPTAAELKAICAPGTICSYCPDLATSVDHVIPLSRGGEHVIDNLVPACKSCNSSKHNKLPVLEWNGRKNINDPRIH